MKILIIDDDISFVTELRMYLEKIGIAKPRYESTEGGAITAIVEYEPDLVICDINLNGHKSRLVLSEFMSARHLPFIIVTQFKDEDLFEHITRFEPMAYFTKPLDKVALKFVINNLFREKIIAPSGADLLTDTQGHYLFLRKKSKYEKVNFTDILFINADGNYITFHCTHQKYVIRSSLKKAFERLSPNFFIQIHRNYVVNYHRISLFDSETNALVIGEDTLPVGRSFKANLIAHLPMI